MMACWRDFTDVSEELTDRQAVPMSLWEGLFKDGPAF